MTAPEARSLLEDLLVLYLERVAAGEDVDLDSLCAGHMELRPALAELVGVSEQLQVAMSHDTGESGDLLRERYRIQGCLGSGGMGIVYRGQDLRLGRPVAIKVLQGAGVSVEAKQRFEREARVLASVQHPAITQVYDFDLDASPPFLVLELVDGVDLGRIIAEMRELGSKSPELVHLKQAYRRTSGQELQGGTGRSWSEFVARIAADAADALAAAHAAGAVHRDVKPSNLILEPSGRVRLLDFGLAQRDVDPRLTRSQAMLGTPLYMAPEQVRGQGSEPRTDVYGLGATLFELIALRPPFAKAHLELPRAILYDEPAPLRSSGFPVSRELEAICLKALQKSPAQRYESVQDMAEDLQRFLNFEPVMARARALPRPLRFVLSKWRRHRIAAVALVLLALGAFFWIENYAQSGIEASRERDRHLQALVASLEPTLGLGRATEAYEAFQIATLKQILALHPDHVEANVLLEALDDGADVAAALDRLLGVETHATLRAALVEIRDRAQREDPVAALERALELLERLPAEGAHVPIRDRLLAFALLSSGQHAAAATLAFDQPSQTAWSYYVRGVARLAMRRSDRDALDLLERALELSPGSPQLLHNLAMMCHAAGELERALYWVRRCLEVAPEHEKYSHLLFIVLRDLRQYQEAENVLASYPESSGDLRSFDHATLLLARALGTVGAEREELLDQAEEKMRNIVEGGGRFARKAASNVRIIESYRSENPEHRLAQFLSAPRVLDPQTLRNVSQELLLVPGQEAIARFLLRLVLERWPGEGLAARALARAWAREDGPRPAQKGLLVLSEYLPPQAVRAADRAFANELLQRLPEPERHAWARKLASLGWPD